MSGARRHTKSGGRGARGSFRSVRLDCGVSAVETVTVRCRCSCRWCKCAVERTAEVLVVNLRSARDTSLSRLTPSAEWLLPADEPGNTVAARGSWGAPAIAVL